MYCNHVCVSTVGNHSKHLLETEELLLSSRGDAEGSKGTADSGKWNDAEWRQSKRTIQEVQETFSASAHDQRYRSLHLIYLQIPLSTLSSAPKDENKIQFIFISALKRLLEK